MKWLALPLLFVALAPPPSASIALAFGEKVQCTAFSINEKDGLWLTAGHCAEAAIIAEAPATLVALDLDNDLALFSGAKRPALQLGKPPKMGDAIHIVGYPGDPTPPKPLNFWGRVSLEAVEFGDVRRVMLIHHGGEPGMSGSPVLVNGKVVSVLLGALKYPSIQYGATFDDLKAFTAGQWKR